jgi:hypothetical protein
MKGYKFSLCNKEKFCVIAETPSKIEQIYDITGNVDLSDTG